MRVGASSNSRVLLGSLSFWASQTGGLSYIFCHSGISGTAWRTRTAIICISGPTQTCQSPGASSTYGRLYNWLWFNNGYHAEHHFRPKIHWTKMKLLHAQVRDAQHAAGVRVIKPPHTLGFLDPNLPANPPLFRSSRSSVPGT